MASQRRGRLTATFVKNIKEPRKYYDGPGTNGLYLRVRRAPTGRILKVFCQKILIDNKFVDLGLGPCSKVSLKLARKKADANAELVAAAGDPREKEKAVPTLAEAAEMFLAVRSEGKRTAYVKGQRDRLRRYAKCLLGKQVDQITRDDVRSVLRPIWSSNHAAASSVLSLLSMIMEWAIGEDHRPDNPADGTSIRSLPDIKHEVTNFPSVPHQEVEDFIRTIRQFPNRDLSVILAFEFKIVTATRSVETCGARWDEIHMDRVVFTPKTKGMLPLRWPCWVIPKERYKTRREIVIPLSRQAIRILVEAIQLRNRHPYLIFPSPMGNTLPPQPFVRLQHRLNEAVPHGFRDSFRTWCQDYEVNNDLADTALGHSIATHGGAYGRSILAAKRIHLMQDWADYNYGETPLDYEWQDRFKREKVHTYPDQDALLIRRDLEVLKEYLESDIAGRFFKNIRDAFASIRSGNVNLTRKFALEFYALTVSDAVQARKARLGDIDPDTRVWTIPKEHNKKKSGKPILIPLSREAFAVYEQAQHLESRGESELLFSTRNGTALDSSTLTKASKALLLNGNPSIFISGFHEWAISSGIPDELIGDALGRKRSEPLTPTPQPDTLKERARLMQKWADFLGGTLPDDWHW